MSLLDKALKGLGIHSNDRILVILIALTLIISLITPLLMITSLSEKDSPVSNVPAHISYATHARISISGNAGFLGSNATTGISWGNGTVGNPYIIEGWDIDASGNRGVWISDATVHFIVRNCFIHGGGVSNDGIYIYNCNNGDMIDNTCNDNACGIFLTFSSGCTATDNHCTNNSMAGIYLFRTDSNTLSSNVMVNCGINIWGSSSGNYNSHSIDSSNTVNGKPVYFLKYLSGASVPSNAGQVILANCDHINVWNQYLSNASVGILIAYSSDVLVANNFCRLNAFEGIYLYSSTNCNLSDNNCSNNEFGILLADSCDNNYIGNNTCNDNIQTGIRLEGASSNVICDNNCSKNSQFGMHLFTVSDNNNISRNLISDNVQYGIRILSTSGNRIWNNSFIDNNGAGPIYSPAHIQASDDGNNFWNSSGYGNFWSDLTGPDIVPPYGIVDWSYNLTGSGGMKDHYPRTTPSMPIPEPAILILAGIMIVAFVMIGRTRKKP